MAAEWPFSNGVRRVLVGAGWSERHVADAEVTKWRARLERSDGTGFRMSEAAEDALRAFGGLTIDQSGPGVEVVRESFALDPLVAVGEEDRFAAYGRVVGAPLFPLGEAGNGRAFLAIAPDGRVFALMDELWELGGNFTDALEALIRGARPKLIASTVSWDS